MEDHEREKDGEDEAEVGVWDVSGSEQEERGNMDGVGEWRGEEGESSEEDSVGRTMVGDSRR